jgi:hypothetical protein
VIPADTALALASAPKRSAGFSSVFKEINESRRFRSQGDSLRQAHKTRSPSEHNSHISCNLQRFLIFRQLPELVLIGEKASQKTIICTPMCR